MNTILHFPPPSTRPTRLALLKKVAERAALETGVSASKPTLDQWILNRPELIAADEVTAILAAELIGVWAGWRNGGKPPYGYWPSSRFRPDVPEGLYPRKAA